MCCWETHIFAYLTSFYWIDVERHLWFNLGNITDSFFFLSNLTFWGLFQVIKFNKLSKIYIFTLKKGFLIKWGCWGHWGYWGCWGHWGHLGSWCQQNNSMPKVQAVIFTKKASKSQKRWKKNLKVALHLLHSNCFYQKIILDF